MKHLVAELHVQLDEAGKLGSAIKSNLKGWDMADDWKETSLATVIDVKHGFAFPGENIRDEPPVIFFSRRETSPLAVASKVTNSNTSMAKSRRLCPE